MRQDRGLISSFVLLVVIFSLISCFTTISQTPRMSAAATPEFQTITPEALAAEFKAGKQPRILCVGFPILYQAAHIPGAQIEGPARETAGLERLEHWARSIPKGTPVVIYCGCCPFSKCPNIRPAWQALRRAGLTKVKVLLLENSFAKDWVDKGYPTHRAK